ncbi:MAG: transcriptional regulator [Deltaproteobacteria bacterium]|nr:transcriptional regulator [Deltaproteobacteria bacterium]TLN01980.1 MAG: transcriptional regulator [bacterium]
MPGGQNSEPVHREIMAKPSETRFPVHRIDIQGSVHLLGVLWKVGDSFRWEPSSGSQTQLLRRVPWFIQDLRPEGFVGKAFARRVHQEFGLPKDPGYWNDSHLMAALSRRGEDCMGNLIVGEEALERYIQSHLNPEPLIPAAEIPDVYPRMAQAALEGRPYGSIVSGEQPKFTAVVDRNGKTESVLVKFSPFVASPSGRRWADLLLCEQLASNIIRDAGIAATKSTLIFAGDRAFLEVVRFDRVGRLGRCPINSLGVVDDEFFGYRDNWIAMADRLESAGMVEHRDAEALRWLWSFGVMIANTDMHFSNASLILRDASKPTFTLAPAYDTLPMLYRPKESDVLAREFVPPLSSLDARWDGTHRHARMFWEAAANDERISVDFRAICTRNWDMLV